MMPAIPGGPAREPRSLVVGFPNGTTLRYARTRDLDAVYVGQFLDRRDWGGRGGSPLEPLGTLTWKRGKDFANADQCTDADAEAAGPLDPRRPRRRSGRAPRLHPDGRRRPASAAARSSSNSSGQRHPGRHAHDRERGPHGRAGAPPRRARGDPIGPPPARRGRPRMCGAPATACSPTSLPPGVRVLIHASEWTEALAEAILVSRRRRRRATDMLLTPNALAVDGAAAERRRRRTRRRDPTSRAPGVSSPRSRLPAATATTGPSRTSRPARLSRSAACRSRI